jgi:hypothetical protein
MNSKPFMITMTILVLAALLLAGGAAAQGTQPPQGPDLPEAVDNKNASYNFTYQGQLNLNGVPYNGACDFKFTLYDSATGGLVAGTSTATNITVTKGLFTAVVNYQTWGPARWIEVGVSCPHKASPVYTPLSPRQALTAAPYAESLVPGSETYYLDNAGNTISTAMIAAGSTAGVLGSGNYTGTVGIYGTTGTKKTAGVKGYSSKTGTWNGSTGVLGLASKGTFAIIQNQDYYDAGGSFSGPDGVIGVASSDASDGYGVTGVTSGLYGRGVDGSSRNTHGTGLGVFGETYSYTGTAGYFVNNGVLNSKGGVAVAGYTGGGSSSDDHPSNFYWKAAAEFSGPNGLIAATAPGQTMGHAITAIATGSGADAIFADKIGSGGYAGYFIGEVYVSGKLSASNKLFKIDDPLDPANKYLYHTSVESPDMKTFYDGVVTLDANGEASVQMPDWFQALNKDFSYQLTCVGGYAPVYISQEVQNNTFKIAGGKEGLKVSWQVTGIRQDAWANANPSPVVVDKPADEQGTYLYPQGFGQPDSAGLANAQLQGSSSNSSSEPAPAPQGTQP